MKPHIVVLDPAVKRPEVEIFNDLVSWSTLPLTHHFPALFGSNSLESEKDGIQGLIILGSASSVNERTPWQLDVEKWVSSVLSNRIPTLGLCYGHQMIAHMFGAKVGYITPDHAKLCGFRKISLSRNSLWGDRTLSGSLVVSHNEEVKTCPSEFECVGTSPEIRIEALNHRTLPIWTFQSHAEANMAFLQNRTISEPRSKEAFAFGRSLVKSFLNFASKRG